ncbi:MAG: hypothetical protein ACLUE2_23125 [Bacteroides cellulosilyticus]
MRSSVEKELKRTNLKLPLTREQYDDWMESLPAETAVSKRQVQISAQLVRTEKYSRPCGQGCLILFF